MAIITLNNRAINRSDTAASGQKWTATSATASDFQAVGVNTPAFMVKLSGNQSITTATWTKITFDSEVYDTDSKFASNKFTPTVVGTYNFDLQVILDDVGDQKDLFLAIYKNGSAAGTSQTRIRASGAEKHTCWVNWSDVSDADDYYEGYIYHNHGSTLAIRSDYGTIFKGYKLIT